MVFKKLLGGRKKEDAEIDIEEYLNELSIREGKIIEREDITYVKPMDLKDEENIDNVIAELSKNNAVVLNIKSLLRDKVLLRNTVKKLREACIDIDGDIGKISNEKILLVPAGMRIIHR